jgi:rhodanese-related sulfurtransferase
MIHYLRLQRISPAELNDRLDHDLKIAIIDLLDFEDGEINVGIPGALRIDPARLRLCLRLVAPSDLEIILYSSSVHEITSARAALALRKEGIPKVWILEGGLKTWIRWVPRRTESHRPSRPGGRTWHSGYRVEGLLVRGVKASRFPSAQITGWIIVYLWIGGQTLTLQYPDDRCLNGLRVDCLTVGYCTEAGDRLAPDRFCFALQGVCREKQRDEEIPGRKLHSFVLGHARWMAMRVAEEAAA